ncbi:MULTISPECIES: pyridoxamine 5'-phosphate oxidase family protein [Hydrogenophaga]|uniref:Pyridoxamine 5'-phosphate oxidase-like protein n=1 Tax=Hydrogenophaga intermedia TaxID=65786 RepID=A0A1L1PG69_HYDIT|nr:MULTISPECIES: pyridoxamine 5'-phosphate oxidase family protein [Hydrogenophaga]AOS77487.1 phosphohydrolase [Hydrogenophaga sp. PBC]TMU74055.1 pyridoxamine 5'-phosphate oxidase family protein [Hydrogenophaga intermedia]CDN86779.1 Pyridoxamine 5'-phosphate oxidase-like protein [Hydrogenophaga intermedia]
MIQTLEQLRDLYAAPGERARRKQLSRIDAHARRFIALSPFCVLASGGANGRLLDASPRGGEAGFVKVLDEHTLLLPDSGGNNRLDTLENLIADPRVSLIFLVPGVEETLRINGRARLRDEPEFVDRFAQERQRPRLVIELLASEVYLHCAKAFMRSRLWEPAGWPARGALPTMNQMISDQMGLAAPTETQEAMRARYLAQLAQERSPEKE